MNRSFLAGAAVALAFALPPVAVAQTAPAAADDVVVATVNGEPITNGDVRAFHDSLPPQYQQIPIETLFPQLVERLVDQKLVAKAARKEGLDKRPDFRKRLAMIEDSVLNQVYLQERLAKEVTESHIHEAYEKAIALEPKREEVRARHILVKTEAEALAIVAELKQGADFAELARKKSTGPSARNGGDLGFFQRGQMVPAFSDAAFALKQGEITQKPVHTQFGWHIIKVEERRIAGHKSFEDMHDALKRQLTEKAYDDVLSGLRAKAKIDIKTPGGKIKPLR